MKIRILTTDQQWTKRNAETIDNGMAVITIPDTAVEHVTFAGRDMVRFDLATVDRKLPSDCMNRYNMLPASRIVGTR